MSDNDKIDPLTWLPESVMQLNREFFKLQRDFDMLLKHLEIAFEDVPKKRVVKSTASEGKGTT